MFNHEKYKNIPEATHFLELQGFRPLPGKMLRFYHSNGHKAAITPLNRGVLVMYKRLN